MSVTPSSTSSLNLTPSSPLSPTSTNSPDSQPTYMVKPVHLGLFPRAPDTAAQQQNSAPSTIPTQTTLLLIVPMPVPGTTNAPLFEGKDTERYLKKIVRHGDGAGITDKDSLVDYILDYCSVEVYEILRFDPEFDPEVANRTWKKASDRLMRLFPAKDVFINDLEEYCLSHRSIETDEDIDKYHLGFLRFSNALIKRGIITEMYANKLFIRGIPRDLAEWVFNFPPEPNQTGLPTINRVVDLLYLRLAKSPIAWNPCFE
ncbi:hypothetical protein BDP27DRAFT_1428753 [Rhodocollybia butyracea]|uniref:Uncharacterized protein n=1 Tax=Rhodocollybia butyracea TaxID=206335 RepID=A0A9P5PFB1_9AGAR|nr:hypothetical protein BDP27DRAFT_1428753 [Rhodocollybia butyracea]